MLLTILLYALFASVFSLQKITLNFGEPFFSVGFRMACVGLLLVAHQWFFNRAAFKIKKSHLKTVFLLGFFSLYVTNTAEIWSLKHMHSAKVCLIYSLSPFASAVIAYWLLKEHISQKKALGLLIGFLGLIPIFMLHTGTEVSAGEFLHLSLPELALLSAVIFGVLGWILLKKIIQEYGYSPLLANGLSMSIGGFFALLHSYCSGEIWAPIPVTQFWPFIRNIISLGVISNLIAYNLYGYLLKRYSATFMSFAGLITPLFASLFGWLFLGEQITWHYAASLTIFSIGLTLFYREELSQNKSQAAASVA